MARQTKSGSAAAAGRTKQKRNRSLPDQTKSGFDNLWVRKGASEREIYAAVRRAFSAADLQLYTEDQDYVPARQILAELEAAQLKKSQAKRNPNRRNGRSRKKS